MKEKEILKMYLNDTFSIEQNELINDSIQKKEIYTDDIKEDFMSYAYDKIGDKYELEKIWEYTDENYSNGLTHKENYNELIKFLNH
jgi:hypothetical protein